MEDLGTFYWQRKTEIFKGKCTLQKADIDNQAAMNFKSIVFQKWKAHFENIDHKVTKSQGQDEIKEL